MVKSTKRRKPSIQSPYPNKVIGGRALLASVTILTVFRYLNAFAQISSSSCPTFTDTAMDTATSTSTNKHGLKGRLIPQPVLDRYEATMEAAREALVHGTPKPCEPAGKHCVFHDVLVALPLPASLFKEGDKTGQSGHKSMVNPQIALSPTNCIVYGMGIYDDPTFEIDIAQHCPNVHAFDCTLSDEHRAYVEKQKFTFHPLCIGNPTSIGTTKMYGNGGKKRIAVCVALQHYPTTGTPTSGHSKNGH